MEISGSKSVEKVCELPVVNVMLTESGIPQESQANGGKDFVHNDVSRAVSAGNHWGEPLAFDGDDFTYSCEFDLKPDWKRENMQIVAYVGNNGSWREKLIANAACIPFTQVSTSGIATIGSEAEAVAVEYYDLAGRRIAAPTEGIIIKRTRLANGETVTEKIATR